MRKQIFLIIVAVVISATTGFCKTRSTLERLWDEYHKYEKLDRPKDQAETLLKIKTDARKIDSAWDFYEASIEYVRVCSSLQYTRRQELQAQMDREVEQFGSPIMLFYHKRYEMSIEGKVAFLLQNLTTFFQGCQISSLNLLAMTMITSYGVSIPRVWTRRQAH